MTPHPAAAPAQGEPAQSMAPEVLKALHGSIAKWEAIVGGTGGDTGPQNCPLCKLFWIKGPRGGLMPNSCLGCPVMQRTGQQGCGGTPYDIYDDNAYDAEELQDIAEEELAFLKSLLPGATP